ncbi:flagellar type III secretion system protein FlhB [Chromobacterium haemolyticum]|uniref:flagellar type III secretion system protein FlhB n=1 Tax=Chromobacterium haemolyticum TaxID=394935 RepID=UPI0009DA1115|nr:flagellar type III secretion system protein FlhB [Chromobacterium haemolyticum]OQS33888.1 flagellar biosynthesis protein FlhB [Chromobacterium haemolyticum]
MSQASDKSEQASNRKLRKAREKGQVARSRDLPTAIALLCSLALIIYFSPLWLSDFKHLFQLGLNNLSSSDANKESWATLLSSMLLLLAKMIAPLGLSALLGIVFALFPGGLLWSSENFKPQLSRLSPISNLGKFFKFKHYAQFLISLLKTLLLIFVLFLVSKNAISQYISLQAMPLFSALGQGLDLLIHATLMLCCVMIIFGLIDAPMQRFLFLRGQRMTKQEVKEEHKQTEGNPQIRNRIRQVQRQMAYRSLSKSVPSADVIIVNPTHYAVALRYDPKKAEAPFVVAKGLDEMALVIRRIAQENGIEVLPIPMLARAIYHTSQVNQQIPTSLFRAVAQVINYIMQLKAFRRGQYHHKPDMPTRLSIPKELTSKYSS